MARDDISPISVRELLQQESDEPMGLLCTLEGELLDKPIYVCSNLEPIISNGRYFFGLRFDIQIPTDSNGNMAQTEAVMDNISDDIGLAVQVLAAAPTSPNPGGNVLKLTTEFIRLSDPDTIEAEWEQMLLRTVKVDDTSISGKLMQEDIINEPVATQITPSTIPGVFG